MDRSPLLELHARAGVRMAERPEAPRRLAPLTFGDVPAEYRAARQGCALFDVSDAGAVRVSGPDGADFLHRLLANHVRSLPEGGGNANLLLSPKGKVLFAFELLRRPDALELQTPADQAARLAQSLEHYHFGEKLRIEDASAERAPLELEGPAAQGVLARSTGGPVPARPFETATAAWRGHSLELCALRPGAWRVDAGPSGVVALWQELRAAGAAPAGLVARDSLRVEAGRPLPGVDVDENVYPQEAGLESALALDKGCYVGQEVVAKIDTYGGLNKRLLTLRVEHSDPVPRGARLLRAEEGERRELGLVTSWAYSFALDTGLVLAYVKRRHQELGTRFELDGHGTAEIVAPPLRGA